MPVVATCQIRGLTDNDNIYIQFHYISILKQAELQTGRNGYCGFLTVKSLFPMLESDSTAHAFVLFHTFCGFFLC